MQKLTSLKCYDIASLFIYLFSQFYSMRKTGYDEMNEQIQVFNRRKHLYLSIFICQSWAAPLTWESLQVIFHYVGYNESGRRIDSTYLQGSPARIRMGTNALVPGWKREYVEKFTIFCISRDHKKVKICWFKKLTCRIWGRNSRHETRRKKKDNHPSRTWTTCL